MTEKQVLEFQLNDEQYCTDVEYVSEIVRGAGDDLTPVPNAASHVEGVLDLRGEMTTILNPGRILSTSGAEGTRDKVIVFEEGTGDGQSVGWTVDDVTRVLTVDTDHVEQMRDDAIEGILNGDDGSLIWTSPETITADA